MELYIQRFHLGPLVFNSVKPQYHVKIQKTLFKALSTTAIII